MCNKAHKAIIQIGAHFQNLFLLKQKPTITDANIVSVHMTKVNWQIRT
jgi:hypothetical protein